MPPIGHKSLQVPLLLPTPALVQPLHPQLLLGPAQGGWGVGKVNPETKLEDPSASQLGPLGVRVCGQALFCIGGGGWEGREVEGCWRMYSNNKTLGLWME